ncbi:MAG TPA: PPC domain-containing protein [Longimicrobium sp.]
MLRISFLAAAGLALALPLNAQTPIRAGQTVRGELTATDPKADDDSHYDVYLYRGRRGENVTFTLRSTAFDAFLTLGRMSGGQFTQMESDDDGAGGTDARLVVTLPEDGEYAVRANTLSAGETGAYTLAATAGGAPASTPTAAIAAPTGAIRVGQTVNGTLAPSDPKLEDGTHYDLWRFTGRAGQRVEAVMRSTAFDSYMAVARMKGGELEVLGSDDDGAGGNDARVRVTLPADGEYLVRANSLTEGETGAYTLTLGMAPAAPPAPRPQAVRAGQTVSGSLAESDPKAGDESYYDAWVYEGRAGERLRITLRSTAFDAFLSVGQGLGEAFDDIETDDDGAGGTDAQVEITLPRAGSYVIRANTLTAGETGPYTLTVTRL